MALPSLIQTVILWLDLPDCCDFARGELCPSLNIEQ
jgi:hypothetical protein